MKSERRLRMGKKLIGIALPVLILLSSFSAAADSKFGSFDRLAAVQKFLDAIYPDLKPVHGLLLSRSEEFHLSPIDGLSGEHIDVVPCRPGSGVPGGTELPKTGVQHCTGLFLSSFSEFLSLSVGYSQKFPITMFRAAGSFVGGKNQLARQEIIDHPEWNRQQMTEAVVEAKPSFGPDQRQEFLHIVPLTAIKEFTGCQLDASTALFWVDRLEAKPDPVQVEIQWIIKGHKTGTGRTPDVCQATFEPFDGKLLSVN